MADTKSRIPLMGSCHCRAIRYILYLTLPHIHEEFKAAPSSGVQHFYRCNCTACHKYGQFHVRPASPETDFILLSLLDPFEDLGDYQHGGKSMDFFFCTTCGVRPFLFAGHGEVVDLDLRSSLSTNAFEKLPGKVQAEQSVKVWRPKQGGSFSKFGNYLSVNGNTIDAKQEGFDMRELTERKQVMHYDCLSDEASEAPLSYQRPQEGGCY